MTVMRASLIMRDDEADSELKIFPWKIIHENRNLKSKPRRYRKMKDEWQYEKRLGTI